MFKIKTDLIKKFESQLKAFKDRALPFATKNAINSAAFTAQKISREIIQKEFVNRNTFTQRSIRVNKTNSLNINEQESEVGSIADYMRTQEEGGRKTKKGKHGVPLPTSFSAGLSENAKPRTKTPLPRFKMKNIKLRYKRHLYSSKKQANAVAIKQALRFQSKYVYLEFKNKQGIFQITGSQRTKKIRSLKMIYDLSRTSVRIPKHEWLMPAVEQTQKKMSNLYLKALKDQLIRHNLFKTI